MAEADNRRDGTVNRVIRLLATLADGSGSTTVGQLSQMTDLSPSTVHRLLQLLRAEGMVQQEVNSHAYTIGTEFYRISSRVASSIQLETLARPFLESLAEQFDETILLGQHLPTRHAYHFTARADGTNMLQYRIQLHRPLALAWGSAGKAILAFLPEDEIERTFAVSGPSPVSGAPLPQLDEIESELARIRKRGYCATSAELLRGARGIAVPIFGPGGVTGSICLASPKERLPHKATSEIASSLMTAARRLSDILGAP